MSNNYPFGKPINTQPGSTTGLPQSQPLWVREPQRSNALAVATLVLLIVNLILMLFVAYVCVEIQQAFSSLGSIFHG